MTHANTGSATFGYQAHSSAGPTRGPEPDQQSHQVAVDANWLCGPSPHARRIKDATCRSVRLAGQDTSTTQKPTSRHVLSRTQRLLHSAVNSHSSSYTTLCCLHRKGRDGLNTELPAIAHTSLSILAKHHFGRSHYHQAERDCQEHHPSERVVYRQINDTRAYYRQSITHECDLDQCPVYGTQKQSGKCSSQNVNG